MPNLDPTAPWPERNADEIEQNPFAIGEDFAVSVRAGIRLEGTYIPEYQTFLPSQIVDFRLSQPFLSTDIILTARNPINNGPQPPSTGTIYFLGESMTYTSAFFQGANDEYLFAGLARQLPAALRTDHAAGENLLLVNGTPTGNTSAGFIVTVNAQREVTEANLQTNLSRGSNFENNSVISVSNSELGGSQAAGGAIFIQIKTTHWPDKDVSTCLISGLSEDAKQYCCFRDSFTKANWVGGAGRCASLAQFGVARPGERAQNCPSGYEYTPGADGLFCTKCKTNTSSFDPTLNPANCPANGVGCQKCCEDPGISCP